MYHFSDIFLKPIHHKSKIKFSISILFFLFTLLVHQSNVFSQIDETITNKEQSNTDNIRLASDSIYGGDFLFNNGQIYSPEHPRAKGNPFFLEAEVKNASLTIKNKTYNEVSLLFDIHRERLICLSQKVDNANYWIIIPNSFINKFQIEEHKFFRLDIPNHGLAKGFYENIYEGKVISCIAKWRKKYLNHLTSEYIGQYYIAERKIYIKKAGKYHYVKNAKEFMELFSENSKAIKSFISEEKINWKKSPNPKFISLIKYYENIQNKI